MSYQPSENQQNAYLSGWLAAMKVNNLSKDSVERNAKRAEVTRTACVKRYLHRYKHHASEYLLMIENSSHECLDGFQTHGTPTTQRTTDFEKLPKNNFLSGYFDGCQNFNCLNNGHSLHFEHMIALLERARLSGKIDEMKKNEVLECMQEPFPTYRATPR